MKVTLQAEEVINLLWDVIAAKGFEKDTYFSHGRRRHPRALQARGHGARQRSAHPQVHAELFLQPGRLCPGGARLLDRGRRVSLPPGADQGPGLGPVPRLQARPSRPASTCPTWRPSSSQIALFKEMLEKAGPDKAQDMDPSFSLPLGEMFSIVVYGQLILEQAELDSVDPDIVNQIFDFMVRDFCPLCSGKSMARTTPGYDEQRAYCKEIMLIKAQRDDAQYNRVWG
ncbi:MAG: hypothetical protein MZV70_64510 [Desulfobacterales bacterium]|nr:hypothetical protein [Desulfobacterales bacterium]